MLIADCSSPYKLLLQVDPEQWVNWVQAGDGSRQRDSQVAGGADPHPAVSSHMYLWEQVVHRSQVPLPHWTIRAHQLESNMCVAGSPARRKQPDTMGCHGVGTWHSPGCYNQGPEYAINMRYIPLAPFKHLIELECAE